MKKRLLNVIVLIILLICFLMLGIRFLEIIHFKCIFREMFGIYCPGCGTTRMIKALLRLNIYEAFLFNPLMFIYFVIFGIYFLYNSIRYVRGNNIKKINFNIVILLIIILLIYMIIRNIYL